MNSIPRTNIIYIQTKKKFKSRRQKRANRWGRKGRQKGREREREAKTVREEKGERRMKREEEGEKSRKRGEKSRKREEGGLGVYHDWRWQARPQMAVDLSSSLDWSRLGNCLKAKLKCKVFYTSSILIVQSRKIIFGLTKFSDPPKHSSWCKIVFQFPL